MILFTICLLQCVAGGLFPKSELWGNAAIRKEKFYRSQAFQANLEVLR